VELPGGKEPDGLEPEQQRSAKSGQDHCSESSQSGMYSSPDSSSRKKRRCVPSLIPPASWG
jgi:hypothetical protein